MSRPLAERQLEVVLNDGVQISCSCPVEHQPLGVRNTSGHEVGFATVESIPDGLIFNILDTLDSVVDRWAWGRNEHSWQRVGRR